MSAQTPGEPRKDVAATVQAMADNARAKSRAKQRDELAARHAAGQLALWPESERGIPNELVRCAVFSAKNRKERAHEHDALDCDVGYSRKRCDIRAHARKQQRNQHAHNG